jgi:molybdate transport system substrate-binding protein
LIDAGMAAVLVAAAISLKAPLTEAARQFGAANPGETIAFTFGSSGQLASQIEHGAPVDLFVSASPVETERLAIGAHIDLKTRTVLAGNRLVVVVRSGEELPADLAGLAAARFGRIAIGNPRTVPVGRYARQALVAAGIADAVEPRLVFAENARHLLELVLRGEVDAAVIYATDAAPSGDALGPVREIPAGLHAPILCEGAVVAGATGGARALAFLEFLASPAGRESFVKHGFVLPRTTAPQ